MCVINYLDIKITNFVKKWQLANVKFSTIIKQFSCSPSALIHKQLAEFLIQILHRFHRCGQSHYPAMEGWGHIYRDREMDPCLAKSKPTQVILGLPTRCIDSRHNPIPIFNTINIYKKKSIFKTGKTTCNRYPIFLKKI